MLFFIKPMLCAGHTYSITYLRWTLPHKKVHSSYGPINMASVELILGQYVKGFDFCFKPTLASAYTNISASTLVTPAGSTIAKKKNMFLLKAPDTY